MNIRRVMVCNLAALAVLLAVTSLAQAQATRTWVSGVGDDANPCSRTAPCKTFAGAISKTATCGEIDVLEGGQEMLSRDCRLIVETHSEELERGCIQRLEALGYSCRIIGNAWYRALIPEARPIPHNRWFVAWKGKSLNEP